MKKDYQNLIRLPEWPDGYYQQPESGIIYYRSRIKNRAVKFSTKMTILKDAKKVVEQKLLELLSANPSKEKREKLGIRNHLLSDLWKDMIDERGPQKEKATLTNYDVSWRISLEEFWGNKTVSDIDASTLKKFENWYLKKHPNRSFFNTGKHLTMFLNYCQQHNYISSVPRLSDIEEIIRTRTKKIKVGRVYSDNEISAILENAMLRTKVGIMCGRYMGMRKKEFLSLEWSKINFKEWELNAWSFKNKKWRTIPIPEIAQPILKSWYAENKSHKFVFPSPTSPDAYLTLQRFDDDWTEAKKLAGITRWNIKNAARIHDLRHTFATHTAINNWPPLVACEVLDMSLKEYQRTYAHISVSDVRSWMKKTFAVSK